MYHKKEHIHFIGIGGIGMSGIASILKLQGYTISGCDAEPQQQSIRDLQTLGCTVFAGNNTKQCHDQSINIVVYSSAIRPDDGEIVAAQRRGIPTIHRALMLAELMRAKYSIAVAGSHGKTTTTSLIAHILIEAQKDPTVIVGGRLKSIGASTRFGAGDFLVAEADESDRSLLFLNATLAVVTNIDLEHVETYADLQDIKTTFKQFLNNLSFYGKAFVCIDDANVQSILPLPRLNIITYGTDKKQSDLHADNIRLQSDHSIFTVHEKKNPQPDSTIKLPMPGQHNVLNAVAAIAVARDLEIPFTTIAHALEHFEGVERRFSFKGLYQGAELFDDYAHHPEEIRYALDVARKRAKGKLIVVFQPHRFTRTAHLWDQFVTVFSQMQIDHLILTDIYAASEKSLTNITSKRLASTIAQQSQKGIVEFTPYQENFYALLAALNKAVEQDALVLFLGAGKLNYLADKLIRMD